MSNSIKTQTMSAPFEVVGTHAVSLPALSEVAYRSTEQTAALLNRLFHSFNGALSLRVPCRACDASFP